MDDQALRRAELRARWAELDGAASSVKRAAATLAKVVKRFGDASGYDALKAAERDLAKLDDLDLDAGDLLERARALAEDTRAWIQAEWIHRARHVVDEIREEFEKRGVALEPSGDGLTLRAFPVTVRVHPEKDRAELLHAGEMIRSRAPLAPARLFAAWDAARRKLERAGTDPDVFAEELRKAYSALRARAGARRREAGERRSLFRAKLPDANFEVFLARQTNQARYDPSGSRLRPYPRYLFAWDLGRLLDHVAEDEAAFADLRFFPTEAQAAGRSGAVLVERASGALERYANFAVVPRR